eukprot:scaffold118830_cov27-Attheya_sp.AAC.1
MLGVMRRCIRFIKATYTQFPGEFDATPKSSTPPTMTPEKQLIYEMLLVRASAHDCTTDLKRAKLAKERINDPMVEDLDSVVAQVSANDVLVE